MSKFIALYKKYLSDTPRLFWLILPLVAMFLFGGVFWPMHSAQFLTEFNLWMSQAFGSFYLWFGFLTLVLFILLAISPLGKIRLGGQDAVPSHSFASWFSMIFCAGMGVGFLFWGGSEPLYHFLNPPETSTLSIHDLKQVALSYSFFHWGFIPWAIYGMTAVIIAFYRYNKLVPFRLSVILLPPFKLPDSVAQLTGIGIDLMTIVAIIFGLSASMGMGVLIIEGGLFNLFSVDKSAWIEILILGAMTFFFLLSARSGLNKGIKILSNMSIALSLVLLIALVFLGPTGSMFSAFWLGFQDYMIRLPEMSLGFQHLRSNQWLYDWTIKYWTWWIAWAPFVGVFIAMISRGRTIREVVVSVMVAPSVFSLLWFSVFGQSTIWLQQHATVLGDKIDFSKVHIILFKVLNFYAKSPVLSWISLLLAFVFIVNSADSATYTMAKLSEETAENINQIKKLPSSKLIPPSTFHQFLWGMLTTILTFALLATGGIVAIQQVNTIMVLPFTIILSMTFVIAFFSMYRYQQNKN